MLNTFIKLLVLVFSACIFNTQAAIGVASVHYPVDIEVVQRQSIAVSLDNLVNVSAVISLQQQKSSAVESVNKLNNVTQYLLNLTTYQTLQNTAFLQQKSNCLNHCDNISLSINKLNPPIKEIPTK